MLVYRALWLFFSSMSSPAAAFASISGCFVVSFPYKMLILRLQRTTPRCTKVHGTQGEADGRREDRR